MNQTQGFLNSLFDFSFTSFVTSKIIKLLYGLSMAGAGVLCLLLIWTGLRISGGVGVITLLIVAPLVFLLLVTYARVTLEIIIVIFRISEHAAEIAEQGRRAVPSAMS
jgi:hypothetical protein